MVSLFVSEFLLNKLFIVFSASASAGRQDTGFINHSRKFFDDGLTVELVGFGDADEGEMGTTEKFFHFTRVAADAIVGRLAAVVEFDSTDGA